MALLWTYRCIIRNFFATTARMHEHGGTHTNRGGPITEMPQMYPKGEEHFLVSIFVFPSLFSLSYSAWPNWIGIVVMCMFCDLVRFASCFLCALRCCWLLLSYGCLERNESMAVSLCHKLCNWQNSYCTPRTNNRVYTLILPRWYE